MSSLNMCHLILFKVCIMPSQWKWTWFWKWCRNVWVIVEQWLVNQSSPPSNCKVSCMVGEMVKLMCDKKWTLYNHVHHLATWMLWWVRDVQDNEGTTWQWLDMGFVLEHPHLLPLKLIRGSFFLEISTSSLC